MFRSSAKVYTSTIRDGLVHVLDVIVRSLNINAFESRCIEKTYILLCDDSLNIYTNIIRIICMMIIFDATKMQQVCYIRNLKWQKLLKY